MRTWPTRTRNRRRDRGVRALRRPDIAPARGHRPHLRGDGLRGGRAGPARGLSGGAFYVIIDGEAAVVVDGSERARLARGASSARSPSSSGRPPSRMSSRPVRCVASRSPARGSGLPRGPSAGHVPDARGAGSSAAGGEPMAELTAPTGTERPHPPGDYPVVVIGSGPGALEVSYTACAPGASGTLSCPPIRHRAGCSGAGHSSSACCRGRSHTRRCRGAHAPTSATTGTACSGTRRRRAIQPALMDGTSYFPSRPEMEANLVAFAERADLAIRYDCRWTATRREDGPDGSASSWRRPTARIAPRSSSWPWASPSRTRRPAPPWSAHHFCRCPRREVVRGRRVLILGKQNSGFELANGLLPWACQLVLVSPSHAKLSVDTRSLVGVRARYVQPYEDHVLGEAWLSRRGPRAPRADPGGDGALTAYLPDGRRRRPVVRGRRGDLGDGFRVPPAGPADLGVATFGASRLPTQTPWWESTTVPGIFFAGTIGQGSKGLQRHGIPANSGAVHGARYNARLLAGHIAATRSASRRTGRRWTRPPSSTSSRPSSRTRPSWHQRGYLARVFTVDPVAGLVDDGVEPLNRARRRRAGRPGAHPRGRRVRRHLPGDVHPPWWGDRGTRHGPGSPAALRRSGRLRRSSPRSRRAS